MTTAETLSTARLSAKAIDRVENANSEMQQILINMEGEAKSSMSDKMCK